MMQDWVHSLNLYGPPCDMEVCMVFMMQAARWLDLSGRSKRNIFGQRITVASRKLSWQEGQRIVTSVLRCCFAPCSDMGDLLTPTRRRTMAMCWIVDDAVNHACISLSSKCRWKDGWQTEIGGRLVFRIRVCLFEGVSKIKEHIENSAGIGFS